MPPIKINVKLDPLDIELLNRKEMRKILISAYKTNLYQKINRIKHQGKSIINYTVSMSFFAGKNDAANEALVKFWGLEKNDYPIIEEARTKYFMDFDRLINDIRDAHFKR